MTRAQKPPEDPLAKFKKRAIFAALALLLYGAMFLLVVFSPDDTHLQSLKAMIMITPVFALQVTILVLVALGANYLVLYIRSRPWYDEHGPVTQLRAVQDRMGTKDEQPYDAIAMSIQFAANSLIIAIVVLSFFLMRSGNSVG